MKIDNSPSLKRGDSPTYTPRGFRVWSSCFPVATNISTPQAVTECPSANTKYSSLRYKKQEKFVPYIPIAKARGFTALSGKIMIFSIVLFLAAFIMIVSCGKQKAEWKATIEEIDGITVVKNPREPMYGNEVFSIEKDEEGYRFVKRYKVTWKY